MIPQRLRELVRVVGIGQSQEHSGLTISLLSLEVYADGCLLLVLFQSYPTEFPSGHPIPEPVNYPVLVTDDRGGQYKVIPGNGSQLTLPGYQEGRGSWLWEPTLDALAQEVRVEIPEVIWQIGMFDEAVGTKYVPVRHDLGPWVFSIPVTGV